LGEGQSLAARFLDQLAEALGQRVGEPVGLNRNSPDTTERFNPEYEIY
jgi:hypothetical protein